MSVDNIQSISRSKGEWIDGLNDRGFYNKCSICGYCHYESYYHKPHPNFCPNCGADMRGEEKSEIPNLRG